MYVLLFFIVFVDAFDCDWFIVLFAGSFTDPQGACDADDQNDDGGMAGKKTHMRKLFPAQGVSNA